MLERSWKAKPTRAMKTPVSSSQSENKSLTGLWKAGILISEDGIVHLSPFVLAGMNVVVFILGIFLAYIFWRKVQPRKRRRRRNVRRGGDKWDDAARGISPPPTDPRQVSASLREEEEGGDQNETPALTSESFANATLRPALSSTNFQDNPPVTQAQMLPRIPKISSPQKILPGESHSSQKSLLLGTPSFKEKATAGDAERSMNSLQRLSLVDFGNKGEKEWTAERLVNLNDFVGPKQSGDPLDLEPCFISSLRRGFSNEEMHLFPKAKSFLVPPVGPSCSTPRRVSYSSNHAPSPLAKKRAPPEKESKPTEKSARDKLLSTLIIERSLLSANPPPLEVLLNMVDPLKKEKKSRATTGLRENAPCLKSQPRNSPTTTVCSTPRPNYSPPTHEKAQNIPRLVAHSPEKNSKMSVQETKNIITAFVPGPEEKGAYIDFQKEARATFSSLEKSITHHLYGSRRRSYSFKV